MHTPPRHTPAAREEARKQAAEEAAAAAAASGGRGGGGGSGGGPISAQAGVSWRVKALARAQQLAKEQGKGLNEVRGGCLRLRHERGG
jgi:hypothetical protein